MLILTTYDLDEYVYKALKAGAGGHLLKDAPVARLAEGVRAVAAGGALPAPPVIRRLITEFSRLTSEDAALRAPLEERVAGLTERETHVQALVAQGLSNGEIAGHLDLAESTVKTHVGRVLMKLSLRDRTQAVVFAYESGVVAARASAGGTADAVAGRRGRPRGGLNRPRRAAPREPLPPRGRGVPRGKNTHESQKRPLVARTCPAVRCSTLGRGCQT